MCFNVTGDFFATCCSISNALVGPSLSSLSGEGKLRKEETSGGRGVDCGVENCKNKEKRKKSKHKCVHMITASVDFRLPVTYSVQNEASVRHNSDVPQYFNMLVIIWIQ